MFESLPAIDHDAAMRHVMLVGATGMTGRAVKQRMAGLSGIRLSALARREAVLPQSCRMEMYIAAPPTWPEQLAALSPAVVICALGTTWRKAGADETAFRAVDQALVLDVARAARAAGVHQFILVSAAGADAHGCNFYLRVKGEVEGGVAQMGFPRLDILRPGLLRGQRLDDPRPLERGAMMISPVLDLFLHGRLRKYRSISSRQLANAIWGLVHERPAGRFIHEHNALRRAARKGEALT